MRELFLQRQNILNKPEAMRDVTDAYDEEHGRCAVVVGRPGAAAVVVGVGCSGEYEDAPPEQAPLRDCECDAQLRSAIAAAFRALHLSGHFLLCTATTTSHFKPHTTPAHHGINKSF